MDKRLSLVEHLEELRSRVIKSILAIIVGSILVYNFLPEIIPFLVKPAGKLVFIAPQEAFLTNIRVSFLGGLFLASPLVIFQIWRFVSAGLKPEERRTVLIFGPFSFFLFLVGFWFGYSVVTPLGIKFLLGFGSDLVRPMISVAKYVSFVAGLSFIFAFMFQLPLICLFLTRIGIITPFFLARRRKEAIVLIFIVAAILTPPDIFTQILLGLPLTLLFELGVIFSRVAYRKKVEALKG